MTKKILASLTLGMALTTGAFAGSAKGLNVTLTAQDAQTQLMAMILSMKTLEQKKAVNIVLCSSAGKLAIKGAKSTILKPLDKSPKMLLQGIIKKGANVKVCPLYLPNAKKDKSALIKGVSVADPKEVAKNLLDTDFQNLSY